jgi:membrane-associated phospholipid phosphatase
MMDRSQRIGWFWTITVGWILSVVLCLGMAAGLSAMEAFLDEHEPGWLEAAVEAIPFSFSSALWIETLGNGVFISVLVVVSALIFLSRRQPIEFLSVLASFFLITVATGAGWYFWDRPRPDFIVDGIASPSVSGFPSGHVTQSISVYGFLGYLWIRASGSTLERIMIVAGCVTLVVSQASSRLVLGAHWPTDIAGGAILGSFWLLVLIVAHYRYTSPRINSTTG